MRVLVACEFSGIVRDAFIAAGHDAVSCDLLPSERPGAHIEADVLPVAYGPRRWDLMIAFPPCTHLAVSGARWFADRRQDQEASLAFVQALMDAPIPRIAIENPIGVISSRIRKPDQIIQPWQFGHGETKATCLWLKGLPKLTPTDIVDGRQPRVHHASPGPDRWKERSRTLPGIAAAMAAQWGGTGMTDDSEAERIENVGEFLRQQAARSEPRPYYPRGKEPLTPVSEPRAEGLREALRVEVIKAVAGLDGYENPNTRRGDYWDKRCIAVMAAIDAYIALAARSEPDTTDAFLAGRASAFEEVARSEPGAEGLREAVDRCPDYAAEDCGCTCHEVAATPPAPDFIGECRVYGWHQHAFPGPHRFNGYTDDRP